MRAPVLLFALSLMVPAQETMIREVFDSKTDTHVEVLALFSQPSRNGFFPVRVKIANNLDNERSIQLRFQSKSNYYDRLQAKSSFSMNAAPGKTVIRDILVPLCSNTNSRGMNWSISADLSGSLGNATNEIRANRAVDSPEVILSEALFTTNASNLDSAALKKSGRSYGSGGFAAKFDPKQLPSDWLAYSGYDSLLLTDTDWSNVPAGARNAILSWVNLGGQLVIYTSSPTSSAALGLPDDPGFGSVSLQSLTSGLKLNPEGTLDLVSKGNPVRNRSISNRSDFNSSWPLQGSFGTQAFNYGIFIAVLIIFGILVGPINLFVFAKSGRRHRLFITTPLISLGASLILIVLIILQDGFGGSGVRRILMETRADGGQNAAFLHQEQISRTGILMSSKFTVDPACLFSPVPIAKSRWSRYTDDHRTRGNFSLQPGGGKMEASGDWWQSRSEHGHTLSAVVPTRGRIERGTTPDQFISTFDFPIEALYFLDGANQWHRAESITTGKAFTLTPIEASMAEPALARETIGFTTRNREILQRAKNRPNHFIAVTGQAPGIDTHPGIVWRETRTVITGPVK